MRTLLCWCQDCSRVRRALPYLSEDPGVSPHGVLEEGGGAGGHQDEQVGHREVQQEQVGAAAQELKGRVEENNPSLIKADSG